MEIRHLVDNQFVVNFLRSVIIAELWRPEVSRPENFVSKFCVCFGKTTPYGKTFEILFRKFSASHRSTLLCSNVVKFIRRKSAKSCLIYLTKKQNFGCLSNGRYWRIASKICQGQPRTFCSKCSIFHPNPFTFGGVIAERVNAVFCPVEYFRDSPEAILRFRRIINSEHFSI